MSLCPLGWAKSEYYLPWCLMVDRMPWNMEKWDWTTGKIVMTLTPKSVWLHEGGKGTGGTIIKLSWTKTDEVKVETGQNTEPKSYPAPSCPSNPRRKALKSLCYWNKTWFPKSPSQTSCRTTAAVEAKAMLSRDLRFRRESLSAANTSPVSLRDLDIPQYHNTLSSLMQFHLMHLGFRQGSNTQNRL